MIGTSDRFRQESAPRVEGPTQWLFTAARSGAGSPQGVYVVICQEPAPDQGLRCCSQQPRQEPAPHREYV